MVAVQGADRRRATPVPSSFRRRQFAPQPTIRQVAFDVAFGIALPVLCHYLDPIVFRASFGGPLLGPSEVVAGGAIGLGSLSLATWLTIGKATALLAGLLAGGALFASLLGLIPLPHSIIGLFALIGIPGLSPFVTAFVSWRNAVRAFRQGRRNGSALIVPSVLGSVVVCAGPPLSLAAANCEFRWNPGRRRRGDSFKTDRRTQVFGGMAHVPTPRASPTLEAEARRRAEATRPAGTDAYFLYVRAMLFGPDSVRPATDGGRHSTGDG